MAKYVKIATFSFGPTAVKGRPQGASIADCVFNHLLYHIKSVLPDRPDLIVLPEVADRPSDLTLEEKMAYYEERGDYILERLADLARENSLFLLYNAVRRVEDGEYRNCSTLIDRTGTPIYRYDKNFPVVFEMTDYRVKPGEHAAVVDCELGRVGALTCFDMNFEELRREYAALKPNLILFSSNYHGGLARNFFAYDTRSYLVASIGCGGPGEIINPLGVSVAAVSSYESYTVHTVNLDYVICHLDENRGAKFNALKNKYGPKVKIEVPSYLGPAIITSECEEKTAMDFVREFDLELLDDYLDRSRAARSAHLAKKIYSEDNE